MWNDYGCTGEATIRCSVRVIWAAGSLSDNCKWAPIKGAPKKEPLRAILILVFKKERKNSTRWLALGMLPWLCASVCVTVARSHSQAQAPRSGYTEPTHNHERLQESPFTHPGVPTRHFGGTQRGHYHLPPRRAPNPGPNYRPP